MVYYDQKYFDWQKSGGIFGAKVDLFKFKKYIKPNCNLIDFGCGGGYLLNELQAKNKIGIEINEIAANEAAKNGIKVVTDPKAIEDNWADVIISNHALEHVFNPFEILKILYFKLKIGGRIIFVVPQELKGQFIENDINQHLYTWTPLTLGNLFKNVGFRIIEVKTLKHRWPPHFTKIYPYFGEKIFHLSAKIYSRLKHDLYQIKIVAEK